MEQLSSEVPDLHPHNLQTLSAFFALKLDDSLAGQETHPSSPKKPLVGGHSLSQMLHPSSGGLSRSVA